MSVTASPAPSRSITPFLKPNHTPFNTPIQSPGTTEHTQTKRKGEELTKHKEPKRPKNKKKAQKHKPHRSNQSSSKQAEPEPKSHLNRHPITGGERSQSRFKLEVYPSSKTDGALTVSDLDSELLASTFSNGTCPVNYIANTVQSLHVFARCSIHLLTNLKLKYPSEVLFMYDTM